MHPEEAEETRMCIPDIRINRLYLWITLTRPVFLDLVLRTTTRM